MDVWGGSSIPGVEGREAECDWSVEGCFHM